MTFSPDLIDRQFRSCVSDYPCFRRKKILLEEGPQGWVDFLLGEVAGISKDDKRVVRIKQLMILNLYEDFLLY